MPSPPGREGESKAVPLLDGLMVAPILAENQRIDQILEHPSLPAGLMGAHFGYRDQLDWAS